MLNTSAVTGPCSMPVTFARRPIGVNSMVGFCEGSCVGDLEGKNDGVEVGVRLGETVGL